MNPAAPGGAPATASSAGAVKHPGREADSPRQHGDEPLRISVPREVVAYVEDEEEDSFPAEPGEPDCEIGNACLPLGYLQDSGQRVEIYRRLASVMDRDELETLRREIRDRFGPLPEAVELLLLMTDLKLAAARAGISEIEVRDRKVMLTRQGELLTFSGKFPRLTKREPVARLKELKKLLLATGAPVS
jgi:transcription-repair coupling factor (superfamily II helicase)